jgi:hypothetical protein
MIKIRNNWQDKTTDLEIEAASGSLVDRFQIAKASPIGEFIRMLRRWGLVVIPDYIDVQFVNLLEQELEEILLSQSTCVTELVGTTALDELRCVTRRSINSGEFTATARFFSDRFMKTILDGYLGSRTSLNDRIYVEKRQSGGFDDSQSLHYDHKQQFKFFLYLTDSTKENGAFRAVPGSHIFTQEHERENRRKRIQPSQEQPFEFAARWDADEILSVEGRRGTLIIFDTDILHSRGEVQKGERKVMRGHCRIRPNLTMTSFKPKYIYRSIQQFLSSNGISHADR